MKRTRHGINEADVRRKAATDVRLRKLPKENYIVVEKKNLRSPTPFQYKIGVQVRALGCR
jgi:hypothetical protein